MVAQAWCSEGVMLVQYHAVTVSLGESGEWACSLMTSIKGLEDLSFALMIVILGPLKA